MLKKKETADSLTKEWYHGHMSNSLHPATKDSHVTLGWSFFTAIPSVLTSKKDTKAPVLIQSWHKLAHRPELHIQNLSVRMVP